MSELKRVLNALANEIEWRHDIDMSALAESIEVDLTALAESIDLGQLAQEIDLGDLAQKVDVSEIPIDLNDVAYCLDAADIAREIEVDPEDIADHLDARAIASKLCMKKVVMAIDLDILAERVTDSVMDSSLPDLSNRILDLQTQLSTIGDHLFILACNLRGDNTASWDATAATLGDAADLVPDNRVDGNGIRIADLEAVEDEIDDLAGLND